jgi:DnaJ-class molecular chaperone
MKKFKVICPLCHGKGKIMAPTISWYTKCTVCDGSGEVLAEMVVEEKNNTNTGGGWQEGFPS